jgi:hypothetical protein
MPGRHAARFTMTKDAFDYRLDILRDEIGTIHTRIGAFDTLSFQVKGWAATLWAGLVGYAFAQGKPHSIAVSIPLLIAFWILDAFFKSYQQRVRSRMGVIERFLNQSAGEPGPSLDRAFSERSFGSFVVHDPMCYQTFARSDLSFQKSYTWKVGIWRALATSNVYLMYVTLIAGSLLIIAYLAWKVAAGDTVGI